MAKSGNSKKEEGIGCRIEGLPLTDNKARQQMMTARAMQLEVI